MNFNINNFKSLESTNKYMLELMSEKLLEEAYVITADFQTSGKGNGSNTWESEDGKNLMFSILLKPDFLQAEKQFIITQIISISVANALSTYLNSNKLKIKWPNDIYYGDNKLGGILIQNTIKGSSISDSVVGIGINVNQADFISDAPNPISLIQIIKKDTNREKLLSEILEEINDNYSRLMLFPNSSWIERKYLESLYKKDMISSFKDQDGEFEGIIQGIDNYGRLIINDLQDNEKIYGFKEVEFIVQKS